MDREPVVTRVAGRYPERPRPLRPRNIVTGLVIVGPASFRLRLDDAANPDAWLEIVLEIRELIDRPEHGRENSSW